MSWMVEKIIAENLKVKPPYKMATKKLMSIAWRLEAIKCFLTRKNPQITKETVKTSIQKNDYQNEKIIKQLKYKFNSVEKAIINTANYILEFK